MSNSRHGGSVRRCAAAVLLAGMGAGFAYQPLPAAAEMTSSEARPAAVESTGPVLLSPTLGRPAFVEPGGTLIVAAQIPEVGSGPQFELVNGSFPPHRHLLAPGPDAAERLAVGEPLALSLPRHIPPGTYDLRIETGETVLVGRHCVAVGVPGDRIRLVHLSNMNVGDVGAPDFDLALVDEVNLLAPTLIVATGDFLDVTHEDPERGWRRLVDFLCRFDAPILAACGDHDDLAYYCEYVAPTPVGVVDVGRWRAAVLFDLPGRPIVNDADQIRWIETILTQVGDERPTFVVSHDERPGLLHVWQSRGELREMVAATRLGVWFSGGHRDWDGREYRALIEAAHPMLYVRTHQSSSATREGSTGVSHFRVVDLVGGRACLPGQKPDSGESPASIPVGRLRVSFDDPGDGTAREVAFTAVNGHPFALEHLSVRVILAGGDGQRPWCVGADLESATDLGEYWDCRVRFGLADKGALRAIVGTGPPPRLPDIDVTFDASPQLALVRRTTSHGLSFVSSADARAARASSPSWNVVLVHLHNRGSVAAEVTPLLRLDGQTLPYVVLDEPGPAATAYRLRLAPGRRLTLQPDLRATTVAPGRRELQVYVKGPPAWRPARHPFEVVVTPETAATWPSPE